MASIPELAKALDILTLSADAVVAITNALQKKKEKTGKTITDEDKIEEIKKYKNKGKGGKGNYTPPNVRKMPTISRELKKGGSVKVYAKGGGVRKPTY